MSTLDVILSGVISMRLHGRNLGSELTHMVPTVGSQQTDCSIQDCVQICVIASRAQSPYNLSWDTKRND